MHGVRMTNIFLLAHWKMAIYADEHFLVTEISRLFGGDLSDIDGVHGTFRLGFKI